MKATAGRSGGSSLEGRISETAAQTPRCPSPQRRFVFLVDSYRPNLGACCFELSIVARKALLALVAVTCVAVLGIPPGHRAGDGCSANLARRKISGPGLPLAFPRAGTGPRATRFRRRQWGCSSSWSLWCSTCGWIHSQTHAMRRSKSTNSSALVLVSL